MKRVPVSSPNATRFVFRGAFTLLELILVVGLLLLIGAMALPPFFEQRKREELPTSANQLRSLVGLIRANAAFEGKRYRLRFPTTKEKSKTKESDDRQPIVEREGDPIHNPEVFVRVTSPWAVGDTFLGEVRCAGIFLGKPSIDVMKARRDQTGEDIEKTLKLQNEMPEYDPDRPPVEFEPDGTTDWITFLLTKAPDHVRLQELETSIEYPRVQVIMEGLTGLGWLQRPFHDEELDLFLEKGWPAVLRKDFLDPRQLTENDVLELRNVGGHP
ncbi:MAG: hypothetical protein HY287_08130 [Planctomycetes bacterium]|nr:hypothetical protein [Planctomycetota bacterium]